MLSIAQSNELRFDEDDRHALNVLVAVYLLGSQPSACTRVDVELREARLPWGIWLISLAQCG